MTLNVSWTLPTTSRGGTAPLDNPIAKSVLAIAPVAADGTVGAFAALQDVAVPSTTYSGPSPAPGNYVVSAAPVDTLGNAPAPTLSAVFNVAAPTPANPDPVTNVVVTVSP